MDGKTEIQLNPAEEEVVSLSLGYTPTCSTYMLITYGLQKVRADIQEMKQYIDTINKLPLSEMDVNKKILVIANVNEQKAIAEQILKAGEALFQELKLVIVELDPTKPKKVILHKPNWHG